MLGSAPRGKDNGGAHANFTSQRFLIFKRHNAISKFLSCVIWSLFSAMRNAFLSFLQAVVEQLSAKGHRLLIAVIIGLILYAAVGGRKPIWAHHIVRRCARCLSGCANRQEPAKTWRLARSRRHKPAISTGTADRMCRVAGFVSSCPIGMGALYA